MNRDSYVAGLLRELTSAVQSGNAEHEAAVRAELARVGYADGTAPVERAVDKRPRERRKP